jgi:UDP-GlcNAc:undecaprenyl-phosphate/decaprenyl-phosphate GlcNAc-1-phosphate transferase
LDVVVEADHILASNILSDVLRAISQRAEDLAVVAVATLVALALLNRIAPRFGMIDRPDGGRKAHATEVPLTGGLALLIGVWVGALFASSIGQVNYEVLALLGIVATIHMFDDQSGLSARQRLVIDAMVAFAFIIITGGVIESFGTIWGVDLLFGWFGVPLTIFAYLTLTNAYNMIDGVDGLALTQFLIAILSVGLWHITQAPNSGFDPLAISVIAACMVVLVANTGRAGQRLKCFLGDSGSRFLGFFLVFVLVSEGTKSLSPIHGAYLIALPLFDMCAVVLERLRAGDGPMQADRRHLHHLILDAGGSRRVAVLAMAAISLMFSALVFVQKIAGVSDIASLVVLLLIATSYFAGRRAGVRLLAGAYRRHSLVGPAE